MAVRLLPISIKSNRDYGRVCSEADAKAASAIHYVSDDTPPFLILHGTEDAAVLVIQSERLYHVLQEKGVRSDYYVFPGVNHGEDCFYQPEIKQIVLDFLNEVFF